jgi:signal transduction histidine kinase
VSSAPTVIEFPRRRARPDQALEDEARRGAQEERQRITRELHDVVSYSLATISVHAGVALHVLEEQPDKAAEALSAIKSASKDALIELREILGVLRLADELQSGPGAPGLGRVDALVDSTTAAGVRTELQVVGRRRPLPAAVDSTAFRIVQEALANVLRHAGPATAVVTIAYERDALVIEVEDDGRGGASEAEASVGSGSGIVGMRQRALAVGGEVDASARPDRGFRVRARLPVLGRP